MNQIRPLVELKMSTSLWDQELMVCSITVPEAHQMLPCCSVQEGDAVFVVKLQDYTATEKDQVTLHCELSKDVPVLWYHGDKEITASKTVVMKSEGTRRTLVLKKVEKSHEGKYVCDCGTDKTSADISIEGKICGNNPDYPLLQEHRT